MPFLERFHRDPFPRNLAMKITSLTYPRRYWVEVLDKDGGAAEVEGRMLADNTVEIKTKNVRKLRLLLRKELFDSSVPVRIRVNGKEQPVRELTNSCALFAQSAKTYADPFLAYTEEVVIEVAK
jgi:hypothetical protein